MKPQEPLTSKRVFRGVNAVRPFFSPDNCAPSLPHSAFAFQPASTPLIAPTRDLVVTQAFSIRPPKRTFEGGPIASRIINSYQRERRMFLEHVRPRAGQSAEVQRDEDSEQIGRLGRLLVNMYERGL